MKKLNLLLLPLLVTGWTLAQNWTGNVSSDWNNSANWSQWPLTGQDISIDPTNYTGASASPIISTNSVFTPAAILINNGGNLTINANLTTTDDVECIGVASHITLNSGTFNVNPGNGGRLIIDLGATMLMTNGTLMVDERFIAGEDATVTINGGAASSGERWLMDGGGQFIQNGGTANCASVFAMADGSVNRPSSYILNGGTLNLTGEFAIENEAGTHYPYFEQNGGTFTLNGDMFWLGTTPGAGRGYFIMNAGTASVSGIIQNMIGTTMNMQMEFHNSAVFNLNGTLWENRLLGDSLIQTGASTININNLTTTLNNSGVIHATSGDLNINGATTFIGTGSFQWDNISINTSGSVLHSTTSTLQISGNITNNGGYTHSNNALLFNGNDQQLYGGLLALNAFDLAMWNTSSGLILSNEITIENSLSLNSGTITSSTSSPIKVLANATSTTGNSSSFVNGPMEKVGNTAFTFPIGKNGKLAQLWMGTPVGGGTSDVFRAEYFENAYSNLNPVNSPLNGVSGLEYWNFEQIIGNAAPQVGLYWNNAATSLILDCNELSVAQWNGSSWDNHISTVTGTCGTGGSGFITTNSTISNPGIFTFGFYSGVTSQNVTICNGESIQVGSNTYTTTGNYIDILQDINMNDSIVITSLTVISIDPSIQLTGTTLEAVNLNGTSYNWLDCNTSLPTGVTTSSFTPLQSGMYALIVNENSCVDTSNCMYYVAIDTAVCQGNGFNIGTNTYWNAGTYSELLISSNALDSAVVLNLTVTPVDTSITISGITLSSLNQNASSFQWIDCINGVLNGETNSVYTSLYNGSFALIVEENGCVDTSACYAITTVGLEESTWIECTVYPNPNNGSFIVQGSFDHAEISVFRMNGELIFHSPFFTEKSITLNVSKGIYLIRLTLENGQSMHNRVVIE